MLEILRKDKHNMLIDGLSTGDTFEYGDRYFVVIDESYDYNIDTHTDHILCFCLDSSQVTTFSKYTMIRTVDIKCEIIEA